MLFLIFISFFLLCIIEYITFYFYLYLCNIITKLINIITCILFINNNKDFINHNILYSNVINDIHNLNTNLIKY